MARGRKKPSLTGAVSAELRKDFNLSNFKEKKLLNSNVKHKEQTWIPLSTAFQEVTSIPGIPAGHITLFTCFYYNRNEVELGSCCSNGL